MYVHMATTTDHEHGSDSGDDQLEMEILLHEIFSTVSTRIPSPPLQAPIESRSSSIDLVNGELESFSTYLHRFFSDRFPELSSSSSRSIDVISSPTSSANDDNPPTSRSSPHLNDRRSDLVAEMDCMPLLEELRSLSVQEPTAGDTTSAACAWSTIGVASSWMNYIRSASVFPCAKPLEQEEISRMTDLEGNDVIYTEDSDRMKKKLQLFESFLNINGLRG